MNKREYKLQILPLFEEDLNGIVDYILHKLKNMTAAINFVDEVEKAIYGRFNSPESFGRPYQSAKDRKQLYYRIQVKNFTIFYVVIDEIVEVRRIIYSRRDLSKHI